MILAVLKQTDETLFLCSSVVG